MVVKELQKSCIKLMNEWFGVDANIFKYNAAFYRMELLFAVGGEKHSEGEGILNKCVYSMISSLGPASIMMHPNCIAFVYSL